MPSEITDETDLDIEVQLGLLGTDAEKRESIRLLYLRYRERLMCWLERAVSFIPVDEVATAINDAFVEIYTKAVANELNVDRPLRPLIFTVAYRRAVDGVRKRSARQKKDDEFAQEIGIALHGSDVGSAWRTCCSEDLAERVSTEFRAFVRTLPQKQKLVAEAMADGIVTDPEIVKDIYRRRREVVSAVEVKGAKQALKKKFREILNKKGIR